MPRSHYNQWRAENAADGYPFIVDKPEAANIDFELPDDAFLDAVFHIPGEVSAYSLARLFLAEGGQLGIEVQTADNAVATGLWASSQRFTDTVHLLSDRGEPAGALTVSPRRMIELLDRCRTTDIQFVAASSTFVPQTYEFVDRQPIRETSPEGATVRHDEDVVLLGHRGVFLECNGEGTITVQVVGDPRGLRSECDEDFSTPQAVREVVFQRGGQTISCFPVNGNIDLHVLSQVKDSSLRMSQQEGEIQFNLIGR